jgi:hypothetical protein
VLVNGKRTPFESRATGADYDDVLKTTALVAIIRKMPCKFGHPDERLHAIEADRVYRKRSVDEIPNWLGINPIVAERSTLHGGGLRGTRWVVERTTTLICGVLQIRIRFDRHD